MLFPCAECTWSITESQHAAPDREAQSKEILMRSLLNLCDSLLRLCDSLREFHCFDCRNWTQHAVWMLNGGWQTDAAERRIYVNLNIQLYLTLNYGTASEHLDFMVLFNVFVAFVGLNNNTIVYTKYRIWISLVSPMPDPQKMTVSEPIPSLSIGSMHLPIYYASLLKRIDIFTNHKIMFSYLASQLGWRKTCPTEWVTSSWW